MSKTLIKIEGKTYELTNKGFGCSACDLIELNKLEPGEVAECVKLTDGLCLNMNIHGLNFKLKK